MILEVLIVFKTPQPFLKEMCTNCEIYGKLINFNTFLFYSFIFLCLKENRCPYL